MDGRTDHSDGSSSKLDGSQAQCPNNIHPFPMSFTITLRHMDMGVPIAILFR